MLKHWAVIGLTVLTLFVAGTYSQQYSYAMYGGSNSSEVVLVSPNARAYAPDYVWTVRTNGYINSDYYAALPSDPYYKYSHVHDMYVDQPEAAQAVVIKPGVQQTTSGIVLYRNYVRPSDRTAEVEVSYLPPIGSTPSVNGKTATLVAPFGYKYYTEVKEPVHPIRDFRADYWKTKYYRDEFHNQASYNQAYGMYNYWNSAASDESSDD